MPVQRYWCCRIRWRGDRVTLWAAWRWGTPSRSSRPRQHWLQASVPDNFRAPCCRQRRRFEYLRSEGSPVPVVGHSSYRRSQGTQRKCLTFMVSRKYRAGHRFTKYRLQTYSWVYQLWIYFFGVYEALNYVHCTICWCKISEINHLSSPMSHQICVCDQLDGACNGENVFVWATNQTFTSTAGRYLGYLMNKSWQSNELMMQMFSGGRRRISRLGEPWKQHCSKWGTLIQKRCLESYGSVRYLIVFGYICTIFNSLFLVFEWTLMNILNNL